MSEFKMTDHQKELFDKLTSFQKRMALNDIEGMKPADNHRAAGGTCKTESNRYKLASEILIKPVVKAFLNSMKEAAVSNAVMSRQEMAERLSNLSRVDMSDLIVWRTVHTTDDEGHEIEQSAWQLKASAAQDPLKMASIAELAATKDGFKIKQHSPLAAMKQLAQLEGYEAAQKHDLNVKSTTMEISPDATPQEAANAYKTMMGL